MTVRGKLTVVPVTAVSLGVGARAQQRRFKVDTETITVWLQYPMHGKPRDVALRQARVHVGLDANHLRGVLLAKVYHKEDVVPHLRCTHNRHHGMRQSPTQPTLVHAS